MTGVDDTSDSGVRGQVEYDWTAYGEPSVAVVEAVAALTDRAVTDLPPLGESVDSDALDALVTDRGRPSGDDTVVRFHYDGARVTVRGDGTLTARATVA